MGYEGRLTALGLVKESTWGTDPTGTTTTIALSSCTIAEDSEWVDRDDLHHGSTGVVRGREELARDVSGQTVCLLGYDAIGLLLEAIFGQAATTGVGPYTHTFSQVDPGVLPSYTGRVRHGSSSHVSVYEGLVCARGAIRWKAREYAKIEIDWIGERCASFSGGSPGTPTIQTAVLPHHGGNVAWNSVNYDNFTALSWVVDHQLTRTPAIGTLFTQQPAPNGRTKVTLEAQARLTAAQHATLYAAWKAGTQSALTVTFTGSSESLAMTADNAQIVKMTAPLSSQGPVMVSITFAATHDGTGSDGARAVLVNGNSAYST